MSRPTLRGIVIPLLLAWSCTSADTEHPLSPEEPNPSGSGVVLKAHPDSIELYLPPLESTANVYAILQHPDGRPRNGHGASFLSENPAIATVDAFGKVTARSAGTTKITVSLAIDGEQRTATAWVDVLPPPVATELAFESSPGPADVGLALEPVRVVARDSRRRRVASFEGRIDLFLSDGAGAAPRPLATTWAVGGIATFSDLRIHDPGTGYILRGSSEGLTTAISAPFDVAPALSGRIAFVSDREGTPKIYVINADGSDLRRLTSGPAPDSRPTWSPDGERIAFARAGDSSSCGIYAMNADGSSLTRLTTACGDITPAWSPDNRRIAFGRWTFGSLSTGIYVMNADGSGVVRLTESLHDEYPAWSPDGSRIAFSHTYEVLEGDWFTQVFVMNADGTGMRPLNGASGGPQFAESGPSWSPDGSRIAYWSYGAGIAVSPGGTIYKGATDPFSIGDVTYYATPDWSPDGSRIVFARGPLGSRTIAIAHSSGGRSLQHLTAGSSTYEDYEPTWTSDEQ